jgi:hypothetical protein
MSAMKELDEAMQALFDVVMTKPSHEILMDSIKQVAMTYGMSFSTTLNLYNDWVSANQKVGA